MASKNDITGDTIRSKLPSKAYSDGWDRIFGKKKRKAKKISASQANLVKALA